MITNTGKSIIGKYMLGQAPAYASFIAVGCGPTPLDLEDTQGDFSTKESLDFEKRSKKPLRSLEQEIQHNPRSRSACLRYGIRYL